MFLFKNKIKNIELSLNNKIKVLNGGTFIDYFCIFLKKIPILLLIVSLYILGQFCFAKYNYQSFINLNSIAIVIVISTIFLIANSIDLSITKNRYRIFSCIKSFKNNIITVLILYQLYYFFTICIFKKLQYIEYSHIFVTFNYLIIGVPLFIIILDRLKRRISEFTESVYENVEVYFNEKYSFDIEKYRDPVRKLIKNYVSKIHMISYEKNLNTFTFKECILLCIINHIEETILIGKEINYNKKLSEIITFAI